jgi:hypothetical protein
MADDNKGRSIALTEELWGVIEGWQKRLGYKTTAEAYRFLLQLGIAKAGELFPSEVSGADLDAAIAQLNQAIEKLRD